MSASCATAGTEWLNPTGNRFAVPGRSNQFSKLFVQSYNSFLITMYNSLMLSFDLSLSLFFWKKGADGN